MIRIAVSQAAFDAVADTLPFGSVGYEAQLDAQGQRLIWLEARVLDKLTALRGHGESYSDVILRSLRSRRGLNPSLTHTEAAFLTPARRFVLLPQSRSGRIRGGVSQCPLRRAASAQPFSPPSNYPAVPARVGTVQVTAMDDGWLTYEEVAARLDVTPRAARSERFGADGRRCRERRSARVRLPDEGPAAARVTTVRPTDPVLVDSLRAHVETLKAEIETLKGQPAASEERMTENSEIARSALAVSRSALDDRFHETVFHGTADLLADSSFAIG